MLTGWKTVIFSVLTAIVGALQGIGAVDWISLVGEQTSGIIVSVIGVVGVVLRFLTTTPIGTPKP